MGAVFLLVICHPERRFYRHAELTVGHPELTVGHPELDSGSMKDLSGSMKGLGISFLL